MTGVKFSSLGKQSLAPIRPWVWSPAQEKKKKKTLEFQKLSRSRKLVGMEGTNTDHFSHYGNHKHYRPQRGGHCGLATEKKITAKSYWQLDICTLHTLVLKNILKCNIHKGCVQGQLPCVTFPNLLHTPLPQRQALVLRIYLEVVAGKWSYSFAPWPKDSPPLSDKIMEGLRLRGMQSAVREEGSRLADWLELLWGDRCCSQTMWMTDVAIKSHLHAMR